MTSRPHRPLTRAVAVLGLVAALAGCGARKAVVAGKVTFRDKPVHNGTVTLFCQDGQIVSGLLTPEGTYTIPNVPMGQAKVAVVAHTAVPPAFQLKLALPPSKDAPRATGRASKTAIVRGSLPERYADPDRSGLSLAVTTTAHTLNLQLRP